MSAHLSLQGSGLSKVRGWLWPWLLRRLEVGARDLLPRAGNARPARQLLVALCDHFEPRWSGDPLHPGRAPASLARERVRAWREGYPRLVEGLSDTNGRPPRHTFFYPGEQYEPGLVEPLAELCERGLAEVEVHLHHDGDTRISLERTLRRTLGDLGEHGLVPHVDGLPRWAFIHGNWCLANARSDGRHCGVDEELQLLHELGCYADLTFPSAPDPTQPRLVNAIYYPRGDLARRRAHERGVRVRVGELPRPAPLLLQGPLALALRGGRPRLEGAALTAANPATASRLRTWRAQGIGVEGRPEWTFVKL